jgi:hypothetical protein
MNQSSIQSRFNLISALLVLLVVYNAIYWSGKFFTGIVPSFVSGFYNNFKEHWGLLIFLEFLAIASIFVDTIANLDNLYGKQKTIRIILTAIFTLAFGARFLIGMIDIYMGGGVR